MAEDTVREHAFEQVERILMLLDARLQDPGVRIGRVEHAIGRYSGFFRDLRRPSRRKSIRMADLLATLRHLAIEPSFFLAEALGSDLRPQTTTLKGAPPPVVVRARERWESDPPGESRRSDLEELDRLRYENPKKAVQLAQAEVELVAREEIPLLLGVLGSAWRMSFHLNEAEHALHTGLEIAREGGDLFAEGDLLQRSGYVFADRGDPRRAFHVAREAAATFLLADHLPGVGRALVDQGIFNVYLDRPRLAIAAYRAALKHLAAEDQSNRVSAFQGLGVAHEVLGELEEASAALEEALGQGEGLEGSHRGKLCWLQGNMARRLGRPRQAEQAFLQAIEAFQPIHPVDTALVTIELVRLQLQQGRPDVAYRTAAGMLKLLEPLRREKNCFISAAIADLLRYGREGFDLVLVEKVARQIQKQRGLTMEPRHLG